ncbi:MAG: heavy metal-responsive transcriptional regulator [Gemmatimonadales bacterium]|jgi:MerR family mercuric resistance operon transcriptional regulator
MRIGTLAERGSVTVQTVRYYEHRGLLPKPQRTSSGYRDYGQGEVRRLRFIRNAKDLGFTLSEIKELLDLRVAPGTAAEDVRLRALEKIEATKAKIHELQRIQAGLERLVSACDADGPPHACALMHAMESNDRH